VPRPGSSRAANALNAILRARDKPTANNFPTVRLKDQFVIAIRFARISKLREWRGQAPQVINILEGEEEVQPILEMVAQVAIGAPDRLKVRTGFWSCSVGYREAEQGITPAEAVLSEQALTKSVFSIGQLLAHRTG
jgi:hypothetical protein